MILHELTALSESLDLRHFERDFAQTNRLRTEGTDILLSAARAAGTRRFVAQSYAGWPAERRGGPVKSEDDPFDQHPPAAVRTSLEAIAYLERAVTGVAPIEGLVLPDWAGVGFGVYPTVQGLAAQFAALLFVIGSYLLAEALR